MSFIERKSIKALSGGERKWTVITLIQPTPFTSVDPTIQHLLLNYGQFEAFALPARGSRDPLHYHFAVTHAVENCYTLWKIIILINRVHLQTIPKCLKHTVDLRGAHNSFSIMVLAKNILLFQP